MWKRYYKNRRDNEFIQGILIIFGIFVLYLVSLWFTDRASFWRLIIRSVVTIILLIVVVLLLKIIIDKIKNYFSDKKYFNELHRQELHKQSVEIKSESEKENYLKSQPTPLAKKLGNLLKSYGWNVEFEKYDGHKHIDIAITEAKFNIEVEGSQHNLNPIQALKDQWRDFYSDQKGFKTKRIPNSLLKDDGMAEETARLLDRELRERVEQLKNPF